MSRAPLTPVAQRALAAELSQVDFIGQPRKKGARRAPDHARGVAELDVMYAAGEWDGARPLHLVLLHERLHGEVYGAAEPMTGKERGTAVMHAATLLKTQFGGDVLAMLGYLRFVWKRERDAERRRRAAGDGAGRRLSWQLVFASRLLLGDYRVHLAREGARVRG